MVFEKPNSMSVALSKCTEELWIYGTNVIGMIPQGICNLKEENGVKGVLNPPKVECLRTPCHCCDCIDIEIPQEVDEADQQDSSINVSVFHFFYPQYCTTCFINSSQ